MRGVCHFYSETGTEGGYWAFQDQQFIGIPNNEEHCADCGILRSHFEQAAANETLVATHTYSLEDVVGPEGRVALPESCLDGTHRFQPLYPEGMWSYEGLHVLRDGDQLTIFDKENEDQVVWQGEIKLLQHDLFSEDAFGMWIHADQDGVEREQWATWFLKEYPAELAKASR